MSKDSWTNRLPARRTIFEVYYISRFSSRVNDTTHWFLLFSFNVNYKTCLVTPSYRNDIGLKFALVFLLGFF